MRIMRDSKKIKKNGGAALVAVLIGVLFITILASSLLFMSTLNYKMKSMRQFSSDNFYTAEFALSDLMTQMKQECSLKADPQAWVKGLEVGNTGNVDVDRLRALVADLNAPGQQIITGLDSVSINCIYNGTTTKSFEKDNNYYYIRGVQITAKTDAQHGEYESTILTDIRVAFPSSSDAPAKLNDFSVLSDCPMRLKEGCQYFGGEMYLRKNGKITYSAGGSSYNCAFGVESKSGATFLGNFNFFDGDLYVGEGGYVYLSGSSFVRGKIYVADKGQLVVGGKLYVKDNAYTGNIKTTGFGEICDGTTIPWANYDVYNDGLGKKLVAPIMYMYGGSGVEELTQLQLKNKSKNYSSNGGWEVSGSAKANVSGNFVTTSAKGVYKPNDNGGSSLSFKDALVIVHGGMPDIHGTIENCTILNVAEDNNMELNIQANGKSFGTLSDEKFEVARKLFVSLRVDVSGSSGVSTQGGGKSSDDLVPVLNSNPQKWTLDGKTLISYKDVGLDRIYYREENTTNMYFTFNCFFDVNMDQTLREFKGASGGSGSSGAQPVISVMNWSKE
ncbi:MAG: hypothetical protein IK115_09305 [Lachnospiraceae bacterium]|nr:hypothetical protein [Lachnospiraceae bacterium]